MLRQTRTVCSIGLAAMLVAVAGSCAAPAGGGSASRQQASTESRAALRTQALVMGMADDYIAALAESVYVLARNEGLNPRSRTLAQSFLRNGVGAALDIGSGPNPATSVLDMVVLSSLDLWSFEHHWIPAGIGEAGRPALERLRRADAEMWMNAGRVLSEAQLRTVRELVDAWIANNPDRMVTSLVRFDEFSEERMIASGSLRGRASGLLREVSEASGAIDDARLLGERAIWFAGRYPFVLGQQVELTMYRLADQPESAELIRTLESLQQLSETFEARVNTVQDDIETQLSVFFDKVTEERRAAIEQAGATLAELVDASMEDAQRRIAAERQAAIVGIFDRFAEERSAMLDDLLNRQSELQDVMEELRETISTTGDLARDLTDTVDAIDRVVARFDRDPNSTREPLRMTDVRDAAVETGRAAQELTALLDRTTELLDSPALRDRLSEIGDPGRDIIDRAFWRGMILIATLIVGLAALRFVPQRTRKA